MGLPFTAEQFFDLFGAYNRLWWPVVAGLWLATCWVVVQFARGRAPHAAMSGLLAAHWAWSGAVYHAAFFARINPAAWLFAALFLIQAAAFVWFGLVRRELHFGSEPGLRRFVTVAFAVAALAYPVLAVASGHAWPRVPLFAVPCPTTLFTTAMLIGLVAPASRWLFLIPTLWSLVGGTAALALGVTPDLMLFAGAACLVVTVILARRPRASLEAGPTQF